MLPFLLTLTDESNHGKIEDIYNKYHEYMLKYAIVKLKGAGRQNAVYDAEDVVQNTFVKITKYINNFDFSRDERDVKNYCFSILNNEICNLLSDNEIFFELNEEFYNENEYNYIEKLEIQENYNKIVKIIEKLDEKYRHFRKNSEPEFKVVPLFAAPSVDWETYYKDGPKSSKVSVAVTSKCPKAEKGQARYYIAFFKVYADGTPAKLLCCGCPDCGITESEAF